MIEILDDLPAEAGSGIQNQTRYAKEMADDLQSQRAKDPNFDRAGASFDPAVLFGDARKSGDRTRISVINFVGMPSLESQQMFLNRLAMTLFAWIKKNPRPEGRSLRGLLVIDEAKDFVPSVRSSPCRASLERLAAQARKYHLGLVFATQNPKEIANTIIGNCSTHYYGKNSSPAGQDVIRQQIKNRGGDAADIGSLPQGVFYFHNADMGLKKPIKLKTALCLSRHVTLEPEEVIERAEASRGRSTRTLRPSRRVPPGRRSPSDEQRARFFQCSGQLSRSIGVAPGGGVPPPCRM